MITLEQLQGQEIFINSMKLERVDGQLILSMNMNFKDETCGLTFYNVSSFSVKSLSYPLQICGFEVIDNLSNGWQKALRYQVHDFEEGSIYFYCESLEISEYSVF